MENKTIILTGTHLTPALALIEKLKKENWQVVYLGRDRSMTGSDQPAAEKQLLKNKGTTFKTILASKLSRHRLIASFLSLVKLPLGFFQSVYYLKKFKPAVVVSFGGYTAVPVCLAAKILSIPLIIHEQTLAAGMTTRLTAPLADKIAISWPESKKYFPESKTVLTGNPVRKFFIKIKSSKSKPQKATIYITGGNQGSKAINETVTQVLPELLNKFTVYHQFGLTQSTADWQKQNQFQADLSESLKQNYHLERWFTDSQLEQIFSLRPLVVSRAGINTVTELAYLGLKAVLIPLPLSDKKDQDLNARFLTKLGLGLILPQKKLEADSLEESIKKAYQNLLTTQSLRSISLPAEATDKLYQLVLEMTNGD